MKHCLTCVFLSFALVGCNQSVGETKNIKFTANGPVLKLDETIVLDRLGEHSANLFSKSSLSKLGEEHVVIVSGAPADASIHFLLAHRGLFEVRSESGLRWFSQKDIVDVAVGFDEMQNTVLKLRLSQAGTARVADLSAGSVGTILVGNLDGEKIISARLSSPITQGNLQFTLNKPVSEAMLISSVLRTGALSFTPEGIHIEVAN